MILSAEEILILGILSQAPLGGMQELTEFMRFDEDLPWTDLEADRAYRSMRYLIQNGFVVWKRDIDGRGRIYYITEVGLESLAQNIRRFSIMNEEVHQDLESVLARILEACTKRA